MCAALAPTELSSGSVGPRWSLGIGLSVISELSDSESQLDLEIPGFTSLHVSFLACETGQEYLSGGFLWGLNRRMPVEHLASIWHAVSSQQWR